MNLKRMSLLLAALCAFPGCPAPDNLPCNACPALEGRYALVVQAPQGVACLGFPAPPNEISISQVGSVIRSDFEGIALQGTLYDTFDFTLSGAGGRDGGTANDQLRIRGKFIADAAADAGADRLTGSLTTTADAPAGDASPCSEVRLFEGLKQ